MKDYHALAQGLIPWSLEGYYEAQAWYHIHLVNGAAALDFAPAYLETV